MLTEVVGVQMDFNTDKHCALYKINLILTATIQQFLPKHVGIKHSWNYHL